jgi:hypothetical protein
VKRFAAPMFIARPLAIQNNSSHARLLGADDAINNQCSLIPTNHRMLRRSGRILIGDGLESVPCVIPRACSTVFGPPIWRPFCFRPSRPMPSVVSAEDSRVFCHNPRHRQIQPSYFACPLSGRLNFKQGCMLEGGSHDRVNASDFDGRHPDRVRHRHTGDPYQPGSTDQMVREAQHPLIALSASDG